MSGCGSVAAAFQRRPDVVAGVCLVAALFVALQAFGASPLLTFGGPTLASSSNGWLGYMRPKASTEGVFAQTAPFEEEGTKPLTLANTGSATQNVTGTREVVAGMEVLLVTQGAATPKAVLLLFHGCSHSAIDWWHASTACPTCLGLPEEVGITKSALQRGWAAVAFSSLDRQQRCWDPHVPGHDVDTSRDIPAVIQAFKVLAERSGWGNLPRYALGASSGGAMVLALALRMPLNGICPMIMAVPPQLLETRPGDPASGKTWAFPPTFFAHMERDSNTARAVAADMAALKKQGVWTAELVSRPRVLTPHFFSERCEALDGPASAQVVEALRGASLLNETGFLLEDPRQTGHVWRRVVQGAIPERLSLRADEGAIPELLNLAWAAHEVDADAAVQALDWLEARRQEASAKSAKMLTAVKPRRALLRQG